MKNQRHLHCHFGLSATVLLLIGSTFFIQACDSGTPSAPAANGVSKTANGPKPSPAPTCEFRGSAFLKLQRKTDVMAGLEVHLFPWNLFENQLEEDTQDLEDQKAEIVDSRGKIETRKNGLDQKRRATLQTQLILQAEIDRLDQCIYHAQGFLRDYGEQEACLEKTKVRRIPYITHYDPITGQSQTFTQEDFPKLREAVQATEARLVNDLQAFVDARTDKKDGVLRVSERAVKDAKTLLTQLSLRRQQRLVGRAQAKREIEEIDGEKTALETQDQELGQKIADLDRTRDLNLEAMEETAKDPATQTRVAGETGDFHFGNLAPQQYGLLAIHESERERVVWAGQLNLPSPSIYKLVLSNVNASTIYRREEREVRDSVNMDERNDALTLPKTDIVTLDPEQLTGTDNGTPVNSGN